MNLDLIMTSLIILLTRLHAKIKTWTQIFDKIMFKNYYPFYNKTLITNETTKIRLKKHISNELFHFKWDKLTNEIFYNKTLF